MTADHELYAALQADVADERSRTVEALEARILELRRALIGEVLDHAGFVKQDNGSYRREPTAWNAWFGSGITPDEALSRLHAAGIDLPPFTEVPA